MYGKCLCGNVEFEILNKIPNLYQCHCSLCQKATGSSSCSSFITSAKNINWITGKDKITPYTNNNGFRSDFCSQCGSPVPNIMTLGDYLWVPAGLLEGMTNSKIAAHIHLNSKASWESEIDNCNSISEGPNDINQFVNLLHST